MLSIYLFMIIFPGFKAELTTLLFFLLETPLYVLSIYSGVEIVIPNVHSFITAWTTCNKHYEVFNCVKYKRWIQNNFLNIKLLKRRSSSWTSPLLRLPRMIVRRLIVLTSRKGCLSKRDSFHRASIVSLQVYNASSAVYHISKDKVKVYVEVPKQLTLNEWKGVTDLVL